MSTEHILCILRVVYTKRDGKIDGVVVKNHERWLKPTTSNQCGQNHGYCKGIMEVL